MKYWDNGFFLKQNLEGTRRPISDKRWLELVNLQNQGFVLYTREDGLPDAKQQLTFIQESKLLRENTIKQRLQELNNDFIQDYAGEKVEDINLKKEEFISLHNELRILQNKEPRRLKIRR